MSKIVEHNLDKILSLYRDGKSVMHITRTFKVGQRSVNSALRAHGISIIPASKRRLYRLNEDYFERIDSHEKAQILGFIAADGCVYQSKTQDSLYLSIAIHIRDEGYLQMIADKLGYDGPLRHPKARPFKEGCPDTQLCTLMICNKKLCSDLIRLGCHPRKSGTMTFPTADQVPQEFLSSYLLGYLEGDGCIYKSSYGTYRTSLLGTDDFVTKLKHMLETELGVQSAVDRSRCHGNGVRQWRIDAREHAMTFLEYLYSKATFYMERKYVLFKAAQELERHDPKDVDFWLEQTGNRKSRPHKRLLPVKNSLLVSV